MRLRTTEFVVIILIPYQSFYVFYIGQRPFSSPSAVILKDIPLKRHGPNVPQITCQRFVVI